MIRNEQDFFDHVYADSRKSAERNIYKYTDCGAWIAFVPGGIKIGSIVEGCDFGTTIYELKYPFAGKTYDRCIEAIEKEAAALWDWANEDHGEDEDGFAAVPDCPDVELDYPELERYRNGRSA